jgi:hypothetical protein
MKKKVLNDETWSEADETKLKEYMEKKPILFEDVAWGDLLNDQELKKDLKKHLKFMYNGIEVSTKPPIKLIPDFKDTGIGLCMYAKINVILDRFKSDHEHYVNTLEDNWISKEFMSVVYDKYLFDMKPTDEAMQNEHLKIKTKNKFSNVDEAKVEEDFIDEMKKELGQLVDDDDYDKTNNWHSIKIAINTDEGNKSSVINYQ